jgi:uncharacterized protein (TIGR00297 family)
VVFAEGQEEDDEDKLAGVQGAATTIAYEVIWEAAPVLLIGVTTVLYWLPQPGIRLSISSAPAAINGRLGPAILRTLWYLIQQLILIKQDCKSLKGHVLAVRQDNQEYMNSDRQNSSWQTRGILLLVFPAVVLHSFLMTVQPSSRVQLHALEISISFALLVGLLRSATPLGAILGGFLTASLIYSTEGYPYRWYGSALLPLLTLFLLTFAATRFGRKAKERLATAEAKTGRTAGQVAANLGAAALAALPLWGEGFGGSQPRLHTSIGIVAMLAALAEATADTLSSELGQVLGGTPRMITTFKPVPAGRDGAISFAGTASGIVGAAIVVLCGKFALHLGYLPTLLAFGGGIFGLFVDSLLGATLEPRWLKNDAVNFLSTISAAVGAAIAASFYQ